MLVRASRHYEGAVAECISLCVRTCAVAVPPSARAVPLGVWVTSTAPARIDLAGGWTDTPPVCYEYASAARAAPARWMAAGCSERRCGGCAGMEASSSTPR